MRLDKLLANSGIGSRSEVKQYVRAGRVRVNGAPVKSADTDIRDGDSVSFDGRPVSTSQYRYYLINKPAGIITATEDGHDRTVMDLFPKARPTGLAPVGRLDKDTVGLILVTNDGELAHRLLSPRRHVDKTYLARVTGEMCGDAVQRFADGIDLGDFVTEPAVLEVVGDSDPAAGQCDGMRESAAVTVVRITIHEGKFHQVKRMMAAVGCEVVYLKRESFGPWTLPADLAEGEIREITVDRTALLQ